MSVRTLVGSLTVAPTDSLSSPAAPPRDLLPHAPAFAQALHSLLPGHSLPHFSAAPLPFPLPGQPGTHVAADVAIPETPHAGSSSSQHLGRHRPPLRVDTNAGPESHHLFPSRRLTRSRKSPQDPSNAGEGSSPSSAFFSQMPSPFEESHPPFEESRPRADATVRLVSPSPVSPLLRAWSRIVL
jgi:hypothetical protein